MTILYKIILVYELKLEACALDEFLIIQGQAKMSMQICSGLRLSLTIPSMMAGIWASMISRQETSRSGRIAPRAPHKLSSRNMIISDSVVSEVIHSARSPITSVQIVQVRSFLGAAMVSPRRQLKRTIFIIFVNWNR